MLGNLFSFDIQIFMILIMLMLIVIYLLSIVWTVRDAKARGAKYKFWGVIALIPFFGVIAYILMRPTMLNIDKQEQEIDIELKKNQLLDYGRCAKCGTNVKNDFIVCPNCQQKLRNRCPNCGHALELSWKVCPYCGVVAKCKTTSGPKI